jgi:hypothetical protein
MTGSYSVPAFGRDRRGLEQESAQHSDTPSLQPSDFVGAAHSANQATIPQHVHRPTQQEGQQKQACNHSNDCANGLGDFYHDILLYD